LNKTEKNERMLELMNNSRLILLYKLLELSHDLYNSNIF